MRTNQITLSFDKIKTSLQNKDYIQLSATGLKISAVVLPFYKTKDEKFGVLLTKRSERLTSHAGQISFPGGKFDEEDQTLIETALREWEEETGAKREVLEIIGVYQHLNTGTGYHITPFISVYSGDFQFYPNQNEVDYLIQLDLDQLLEVPFYALHLTKHPSGRFEIYYFDLPQGLLWGATCHILIQFLKEFSNFNRQPEFVKPNLTTPPFFLPPKKT